VKGQDRAVALIVFVLMAITSPRAQQQPSPGPQLITRLPESTITGLVGIQPLTSGTLEEAIHLGSEKETGDVISRGLLVVAYDRAFPGGLPRTPDEMQRAQDRAGVGKVPPEFVAVWLGNIPFSVFIESPFVRAASQVSEARRKYQPQPVLNVGVLNASKVTVVVSPGRDFTKADAIENVVIKRGTDILRPTATTLTPTVISNAMGASRELSQGRFTFDFPAFATDAPITMVLIGRTANTEIPVPVDVLKQLR
jgi:hypothetical protein